MVDLMKKLTPYLMCFLLFIQKNFCKKKTIAIKSSCYDKSENLFLQSLSKHLNKYSNYFAIEIPQNLLSTFDNQFVDWTIIFNEKKELQILEKSSQTEGSTTIKENIFCADISVEEVCEKIFLTLEKSEWADYNDRLQSHHFAGSL